MLPNRRDTPVVARADRVPASRQLLWFAALYLVGVLTLLTGSWLLKDLLTLLR